MSAAARRVLCACVLAAGLVAAAREGLTEPRAAVPGQAAEAGRSWPGKPQPAIAVEYRLSAVPAVGVPLVVTIIARAAASIGNPALDVRTAAGLGVPSRPVPGAQPDERAWEVPVTPAVVPACLKVLVTADGAGGPLARSIVVPLGAGACPRPDVRVVELYGERILALPAQESQGSR